MLIPLDLLFHSSSYVVGIVLRKIADFYRSRNRWEALESQPDLSIDEPGHPNVLDKMTILAWVREFLDSEPVQAARGGRAVLPRRARLCRHCEYFENF